MIHLDQMDIYKDLILEQFYFSSINFVFCSVVDCPVLNILYVSAFKVKLYLI